MVKKLFITFEGIDGCGKDTQLNQLVVEARKDNNYPFGNKYSTIWITREPTQLTDSGKEIGRRIREEDVSAEDATRLYVQDRVEHSRIIESMLHHSYVFTSRYDLSTLAYQMTQGMDFETLYSMHNYGEKNGTLIPDITLVFKLDEEEANKRISNRSEIKECFEKRDFQQKLTSSLNYCIDELRKRGRTILEINANQTPENVTKEMLDKISQVLNEQE